MYKMNIQIGKWYRVKKPFGLNAFDARIVQKNWFTYTAYYKVYDPDLRQAYYKYGRIFKSNIMELSPGEIDD